MFYWISESIEFLKKNYLHVQICSFCRLLLEEETIFDPFRPPFDAQGAPKRSEFKNSPK